MNDTPGETDTPREDSDTGPVPTTDDGIPLIVNGVRLGETQLAALREARARRAVIDAAGDLPPEEGGATREAEATRYGDWEKAGRAVDF